MKEFHEITNIFPEMGDKEYRVLVEDIREHDLREPIWTYQGKIIDGRHRYRACLELGIEPRFREWDGNGSLVALVISLNLHRRHLTSSQRAAIAVEILPRLEEEARERQRQATLETNIKTGKINSTLVEKFPQASRNNRETVLKEIPGQEQENNQSNKNKQAACSISQLEQSVAEKAMKLSKGRAREQAAKITGTNPQYVSTAKKVKEKDPEVLKKVKEGKLTLPEAKKIISLPEEIHRQVIEKIENGKAKNIKDAIEKIEQQTEQKAKTADISVPENCRILTAVLLTLPTGWNRKALM